MTDDSLQKFTIPGHLTLNSTESGQTKATVQTEWSHAEIHLHGAHVTSFQKNGEAPLLFLSKLSQFTPGKAIRGGVPIIFPWFGGREGYQAHGFARTAEWTLEETAKNADGSISLRFLLPEDLAPCRVEYLVTVGKALTLELVTTNSTQEAFAYEDCLHTYFHVGSIHDVTVHGLQGTTYIDQLDGNARKAQQQENIIFSREEDRIYLNTPSVLEIRDVGLQRKILLETSGSRSAVVWNPWIEKSARMADFGDEEYLEMVCVESGNVADNRIQLPPGGTATLKLTLKTLIL